MPRVILTGGPGAGKTTLLSQLGRLGYRTVPESARAIIAERLARGDAPRPAPLAFAQEVLRRDVEKFRANPENGAFTFFDRSALESLAMVHEACPMKPPELQAQLSELEFHKVVFVLPPWEAIYVTDTERDHTFDHAVRVHEAVSDWYTSIGYSPVSVPVGPVESRADFVLKCLEGHDA